MPCLYRDDALLHIFDRIGEKLLYHKREPFFITGYDQITTLVLYTDLFADHHFRIFVNAVSDDPIQCNGVQDIIMAVLPLVLQCHTDILLDPEKLLLYFFLLLISFRRFFPLRLQ